MQRQLRSSRARRSFYFPFVCLMIFPRVAKTGAGKTCDGGGGAKGPGRYRYNLHKELYKKGFPVVLGYDWSHATPGTPTPCHPFAHLLSLSIFSVHRGKGEGEHGVHIALSV